MPVLQSSANAAGAPDARRLDDVPEAIRAGADLVLDAGELPGTPSTVIDLRRFEAAGEWDVVRARRRGPERSRGRSPRRRRVAPLVRRLTLLFLVGASDPRRRPGGRRPPSARSSRSPAGPGAVYAVVGTGSRNVPFRLTRGSRPLLTFGSRGAEYADVAVGPDGR